MWCGGCAGEGSTVVQWWGAATQGRAECPPWKGSCEVIWLEQGACGHYGARTEAGTGAELVGRFALIPLVTFRHVDLWTPTACSSQPAPRGWGWCGSRAPHWRSFFPSGKALLEGMFALCFQMDQEEQDILGIHKLSSPGPTQEVTY